MKKKAKAVDSDEMRKLMDAMGGAVALIASAFLRYMSS
jgi:hypothetical protein